MQTELSPYEPITPEVAASGLLISIKQAAEGNDCSECTIRANAKARRLRAFQLHFGAPVMVLPSDVEAFLKARPDIASNHHPKCWPVSPPAGYPPTPAGPNSDGTNTCGAAGDRAIRISIRSLAHATLFERALVSACLIEVARAINNTPHAVTNTNQIT